MASLWLLPAGSMKWSMTLCPQTPRPDILTFTTSLNLSVWQTRATLVPWRVAKVTRFRCGGMPGRRREALRV